MRILNVKIDNLSREEALEKVAEFLSQEVGPRVAPAAEVRPLKTQYIITTPNPEIILEAQKDKEFRNILNQADLALPDGIGLILMSKIIGQPIKEQICGSDFIYDICALAEKMEKSVFLLGAGEGVAKKAAVELIKKYPRLKIVGAEKGLEFPISNFQFPIIENNRINNFINSVKPDILFVAFGHGKQEKWIAQNLAKMPSVKIAMGVGGAFNFIAGIVPRAPRWLRKIGLEWLWRLILEPRRIKRIYNAVVKFPIKVIFNRNGS